MKVKYTVAEIVCVCGGGECIGVCVGVCVYVTVFVTPRHALTLEYVAAILASLGNLKYGTSKRPQIGL